jgi:cell division protease FtsH
MVTQYGMSDKIGTMALATTQSEYLDGTSYMDCSQNIAAEADAEVRSLLAECFREAKSVLGEHRELLDEISLYLLQKETITGDELMAYVTGDSSPSTEGSRYDG